MSYFFMLIVFGYFALMIVSEVLNKTHQGAEKEKHLRQWAKTEVLQENI